MGNFPNNPLCQFNEGNDQMNGLEQDQPGRRAVHRCSPKQDVHMPYLNLLSCMYGTLCPRERKIHIFGPFLLVLYILSQYRSTPWPKLYQLS